MLPKCPFNIQHNVGHRDGILRVTAKQSTGSDFATRVCPECFNDLIDSMRDGGFTDIKITAPEQPQRKAWK